MIPKIIHYCWFGGNEKPDDVKLCIKSWKEYLPDYTIIEWNESNINILGQNQYVREAYECKKWAFVSDYVRLKVLYEFGGIYFDTDVEVFKSFDSLIENTCFFGFESKDYLSTAVIACEKNNFIINEFLKYYENRKFIKDDGKLDMTTNVTILTKILIKHGLKRNGKKQIISDSIVVYPQYFFSSNDFINIFGFYRKDIYAYHHCAASWYDKIQRKNKISLVKHYLIGMLRNIIGTDFLKQLKKE